MEEPQKLRKRQILVIGRNTLEHFETLRRGICDRLKSQLLIHTDCGKAVSELSPTELRRSDAVLISHDRKEGVWGSRRLLGSVSTLQALKIGTIIVVGAYGWKLRKKLRTRAVSVHKEGLADMTEDSLVDGLQAALGTGEETIEERLQQEQNPSES